MLSSVCASPSSFFCPMHTTSHSRCYLVSTHLADVLHRMLASLEGVQKRSQSIITIYLNCLMSLSLSWCRERLPEHPRIYEDTYWTKAGCNGHYCIDRTKCECAIQPRPSLSPQQLPTSLSCWGSGPSIASTCRGM